MMPTTETMLMNTRRKFLSNAGSVLAASAAALVVDPAKPSAAANDVHEAAAEIIPAPKDTQENPELLKAHDRLIAAAKDELAAHDALNWIADEWRHAWPLAPEELLEGAGADMHYSISEHAERDIIGRPIQRDTSVLTKRLSKKYRQNHSLACFYVMTATQARKDLESWVNSVSKGRTPKSIARNIAYREDQIRAYGRAIILAEQYEAETARLRKVAGVEEAKERLRVATLRFQALMEDISFIPSYTLYGLKLKTGIILSQAKFISERSDRRDVFGQIGRLLNSIDKMEEGVTV